MKALEWFAPPRTVLMLFIALMLICALALGWLGWQVLVQDRAVEAQQRQEQLENAADRAVAAIERAFTSFEIEIAVASNGEVEMVPAGRLAYVPPVSKGSPNVDAGIFAAAEALEFARHDGAQAAEAYRRLAESTSAPVRGEALMRLGRALRRDGQWAGALEAYAALEKLGAISLAGMPAGLVARAARCSVLNQSGDSVSARRAAAEVWRDLTAGKWNLTKPTLETYLEELSELAPELSLPAAWQERVSLAEAAAWAFAQPQTTGRAGLLVRGQTVSVSWERQGATWKARLAGPTFWQAVWRDLEHGVTLRVVDAEGHLIRDNGTPHGPAAFRAAAMTGLPWSVTVTSAADSPPSGAWTARRRFVIGGLGVFSLVLGLGTFLIARAISRELGVARLQSDFVSAVSHEFRTPLTSIHQLMEMLAAGRMDNEQDKQRAYDLMLGQSDRLRRLVETLLDFGRMQAREYKFRCEMLEATQWSRSISEEFQETVRSRGYAIEFTAPPTNAWIRGDREALGGALWNLLDNAVKYSPDEKQVSVAVSPVNGSVEVSVRDHGTGIARDDLKRVFGKFYRGVNAKKQGTKGTGIGLAMVKEIVEAHGGSVRVRSEPGKGSEFTMVLPCHES